MFRRVLFSLALLASLSAAAKNCVSGFRKLTAAAARAEKANSFNRALGKPRNAEDFLAKAKKAGKIYSKKYLKLKPSNRVRKTADKDLSNYLVPAAEKILNNPRSYSELRHADGTKALVFTGEGETVMDHTILQATRKISGLKTVYDPVALAREDTVAMFRAEENTVYVSQEVIAHPNRISPILLHEIRHAKLKQELADGVEKDFLGYVYTNEGRLPWSGQSKYSDILYFEEADTFLKTTLGYKQLWAEAVRAGKHPDAAQFLRITRTEVKNTEEILDQVDRTLHHMRKEINQLKPAEAQSFFHTRKVGRPRKAPYTPKDPFVFELTFSRGKQDYDLFLPLLKSQGPLDPKNRELLLQSFDRMIQASARHRGTLQHISAQVRGWFI